MNIPTNVRHSLVSSFLLVALLLAAKTSVVTSFLIHRRVLDGAGQQYPRQSTFGLPLAAAAATGANIDFQSDTSQYGRGEMHLSAVLEEEDVVVYQTGFWYVDGVVVGDDTLDDCSFEYCKIETLQVVWTHNCEHGVLRGQKLLPSSSTTTTETSSAVTSLTLQDEFVEFGPEQLIARVPVEWDDDELTCHPVSAEAISDVLWHQHTLE